jgi:hypothetical protein
MSNYLNEYIARFENMPAFNIAMVSRDGMRSSPWYEVQPTAIVRELVLDELNVALQVQTVTAEIQKWGRLGAQARRVWQLEERGYRAWRSQFFLEATKRPENDEDKPGWTRTAKGEPKVPTKETIEAMYRVAPEYHQWQVRIEKAEETYNAVQAVYEAFKAKKDMLKQFAYRNRDSGQAQLAV